MIAGPARLVLLGHPVTHSLSPVFQRAALAHCGIPLSFDAIDVASEALPRLMRQLVEERAAGNVTIPHKQAVAALCARLTAVARRAGAVNTFWVEEAGSLIGDNTDVPGFEYAVRHLLEREPRDLRIALLGAGGAARAVLAAVEGWQGCEVTIYNRDTERASRLAEQFSAVTMVAGDAAAAAIDVSLVVNATSVGLDGHSIPMELSKLRGSAAVLDLVYRPGGTRWVRMAQAEGRRADDGLTMLLEQGALAFERWTGRAAPRDVMRSAVGL